MPGAVTPFAVFLFRQFYLDLPVELEEAARLDGLGEFRIYARIMTPQVKPALTTVALLTFESSWNNFLWPLLVTRTDSLRVIQVGLSVFKTENGTQWHFLMAGTTLATLPMVILFLIGQRYFVQGFATAAISSDPSPHPSSSHPSSPHPSSPHPPLARERALSPCLLISEVPVRS